MAGEYVSAPDGVRLWVERVGRGRDALIVPGGIPMLDMLERCSDDHVVLAFDQRSRGRSDKTNSDSAGELGIHCDVDDLEAVRQHAGCDRVDLLGHSYLATAAILYALKWPHRVRRIVQIAPMAPDGDANYLPQNPEDVAVRQSVLAEVQSLMRSGAADPEERCRQFWRALAPLYVTNPDDEDPGSDDPWGSGSQCTHRRVPPP